MEFWATETLGCDPFSRIGACGRRPSESADPGASARWVVYRDGIGCIVERKLYGGRGLGLVGDPQMSAEVFEIRGFISGFYLLNQFKVVSSNGLTEVSRVGRE